MFYYSIANLRPELRSLHRCIRLIAVVTSPLLHTYGFGKVLEPFIKDVNKLCTVSKAVCILRFIFTCTYIGWCCGEM